MMGVPFPAEPRKSELIAGCIWFVVWQGLLAIILEQGMTALGIEYDTLRLNAVYLVSEFVITAIIFHRFLADSLMVIPDNFLLFLKSLVLSYILYEVLLVGSSLVVSLVAGDYSTSNDEFIGSLMGENSRVMWAGAVLLAPLAEETMMRGLLFGYLRRWNRILAYIVTALVFAFLHMAQYLGDMTTADVFLNLLLYGLPSIALCFAYEMSYTIWAPIVLHAILNAISMGALSAAG